MGDCMTDKDAISYNIPILLYIARRAPLFSALEINSTLVFGHILSSNIELCLYLSNHLEVLRFCAADRTSSFLELVQIVDKIYPYSLSTLLKKLTIVVDSNPKSWLTLDHFQNAVRLVFNRLPTLIHFTLYCYHGELFEGTNYDLNELASECYREIDCSRSWSWRSKPNAFDLWL